MADGTSHDRRLFLSLLPAQRHERRLAAAVCCLSLIVFGAAIPFATVQLPRVEAFIPAYQAALSITDLITAVMLFGQYAIVRTRGLMLLACAYLFASLMVMVHTLSFPGLFSETGLLGAGPQTTAWLYMAWHAGFPLLVIGYALDRGTNAAIGLPADLHRRNGVRRAMLSAVGLVVLAVALLTALATAGHDTLPAIMDGSRYTPLMVAVVAIVWGLTAGAFVVLLLRRRHSVLDLWLMMVMLAWQCDVGLSAVFNAGRFDLGFYTGRIFGLMAASFVLVMLLLETRALFARLARSLDLERASAEARAREQEEVNRILRESEESLRQLNETLEQRVAERSRQLEAEIAERERFQQAQRET